MQRCYRCDDIVVDLCFFWRDGDRAVTNYDVGAITIAPHLTHPLQQREFEGATINMPSQPEAWVEWWYGPDWRTPNPHWRADLETFCLKRWS